MLKINRGNLLKPFLLSAGSFTFWVGLTYEQGLLVDRLLQSYPATETYLKQEINGSFLFTLFPLVLVGFAIISFLFGCWQVHRWITAGSEPFDFYHFLAKEIFKGFHMYTVLFILIILLVSGFYLLAHT